jgi:hypothetical protein
MELNIPDEVYESVEVIDHGIVQNADPSRGRDIEARVFEFVFVDGNDAEYRHAVAITPITLVNNSRIYDQHMRNGKLVVLAQAGAL